MKRFLHITLVSALSLFLLLLCFSCDILQKKEQKTDEVPEQTVEFTWEKHNWMKHLSDELLLSQINIPGSHDSGASDTSGINGVGATQEYSLAEQLAMGVRGFDIRLKVTKEGLKVFHGILDEKLFFSEVEQVFSDFLAENPSETLIMFVKNEGDDDEEFCRELNPLLLGNDFYFTEDRNPTLGEVRGKVVLFRRYPSAEEVGVNARDGWSGDTFTMENNITMHVQDNYYSSWWTSMDQKWEEFISLYEIECAEEEYYINFASCYVMTRIGSFEIPTINTASEKINNYIREEFSLLPSGYYGFVYMDFVDEEIAEIVIEKNF